MSFSGHFCSAKTRSQLPASKFPCASREVQLGASVPWPSQLDSLNVKSRTISGEKHETRDQTRELKLFGHHPPWSGNTPSLFVRVFPFERSCRVRTYPSPPKIRALTAASPYKESPLSNWFLEALYFFGQVLIPGRKQRRARKRTKGFSFFGLYFFGF